jgi:hypothetical protein
MRQIKAIFLSFLLVAVLLCLISLLLPSKSVVSRSIDITGSKHRLQQFVGQANQWRHWNKAIKSVDSVGSTLQVDTVNNTLSVENITLRIKKESDSLFTITTSVAKEESMLSNIRIYYGDSTHTLNWKWHFTTKWYPWERFKSIFYDKMFGAVLDSNLTALKKVVEL